MPQAHLNGAGQLNFSFKQLFGTARAILNRHLVSDARLTTLQLGNVVVALDELRGHRGAFFFNDRHHFVNKRGFLAAVLQQAFGLIAWLAFTRVWHAAVIGIANQFHSRIGNVFGQHVRTRAHRPCVWVEVPTRHAVLGIEGIYLPRNGRKESHGQPIFKLGVLAHHPDFQSV